MLVLLPVLRLTDFVKGYQWFLKGTGNREQETGTILDGDLNPVQNNRWLERAGLQTQRFSESRELFKPTHKGSVLNCCPLPVPCSLPRRGLVRTLSAVAISFSLAGCVSIALKGNPQTPVSDTPNQPQTPAPTSSQPETPDSSSGQETVSSVASSSSLPNATPNRELLEQSWDIYRKQFIQADGRVIDYQASDRSTSEGQGYAMLRAVLINDPTTFGLTLKWAENNLHRLGSNGQPTDQLWAWKWGQLQPGKWGPIDRNFASDADIDAITALILASRRWNRPEYLDLARTKLRDLWKFSTVATPGGKRYLLPGPVEAFVPSPSTIYLNPSYFAPYAFRLFAQVDRERDWLSLVSSSYEVLEKSSKISAVGLPSDWIAIDTQTGKFQPMPSSSPLQSVYSFDAYRIWWRVAWDAAWFQSPDAQRYLETATKHLQAQLQSSLRLPARINLQGKPTVNYEATSQYAMLYPSLSLIDPTMAEQIVDKKLLPRYKQGIWDDESAYYTQNLAWIGLLPPTSIDPQLLQPQ